MQSKYYKLKICPSRVIKFHSTNREIIGTQFNRHPKSCFGFRNILSVYPSGLSVVLCWMFKFEARSKPMQISLNINNPGNNSLCGPYVACCKAKLSNYFRCILTQQNSSVYYVYLNRKISKNIDKHCNYFF